MERSFEIMIPRFNSDRTDHYAIVYAETASQAKYQYYLRVDPDMHFFDFIRPLKIRVIHDKRGGSKMRKQPELKLSGLVEGEQVVMHTCREAAKYADKVWTTRSKPWDLCGSEVILLEGFSGGFATEYLRKV